MADTKDKIVSDIQNYMSKFGGRWCDWYVGISKDARNRLFVEHKVDEQGGAWVYCQAVSSPVARDAESFFVNTQGTDGGTGGGDETADMVYAYKKTGTSNP